MTSKAHNIAEVSMNVELVALIVKDYDTAIRFFVDVLRFDLIEDTPSRTNDGRPKRWVVVRPPEGQSTRPEASPATSASTSATVTRLKSPGMSA